MKITTVRSIAALWFLMAIGANAQVSQTIFNTYNVDAVGNRPRTATVFNLSEPMRVTSIMTYHWNHGRGAPGGTVSVRSADGRVYGPWPVTASSGSGAQNVNWTAQPNVVLPAGSYTVLDSDAATWSQNLGSSGRGFAEIRAIPVGPVSNDAVTEPAPATPGLGDHKLIQETIPGLWGHAKADITWYAGAYNSGAAWLGAAGNGQYKILHGTAKFHSANGALEATVEYRDGYREGESCTYWENGGRQSVGTYHADKLVPGMWKVWDRNGTPSTSQETGVYP